MSNVDESVLSCSGLRKQVAWLSMAALMMLVTCVKSEDVSDAKMKKNKDTGLYVADAEPRVLIRTAVPGEFLNQFVHKWTTPHQVYNKPSCQRPIKTLFVIPWNLAAREVAELVQRMDLEFDVVTTRSSVQVTVESADDSGPPFGVEGTSLKDKTQALMDGLDGRPEVVVLGNFKFAALPIEVQEKLLKQVRSGMGLVAVYDRGLEEILQTQQDLRTASESNDVILPGVCARVPHLSLRPKAYMLGNGRVVIFDYGKAPDTANGGPGLTPNIPYHRIRGLYDYFLAPVARGLLWAAGRAPAARIVIPVVQKADLNQKLEMQIDGEPGKQYSVRLSIRDVRGRVEHSSEKVVPTGAAYMDLPILPNGGHFADVWLLADGRIADWGTTAIQVDRPRIVKFTSELTTCRAGLAASLTIDLNSPLGVHELIQIVVRDSDERILQIERIPAEVGATRVCAAPVVAETPTIAMRFESRVISHGQLMDWRELTLYAPCRPESRFASFAWGVNGSSYVSYLAYRAARQLGVEAIMGSISHLRQPMMAEAGLRPMGFTQPTSLSPGNKEDFEKGRHFPNTVHFAFEDWRHPQASAAYLQEWGKVAESIAHFGPLVYTLGDENKIGGRNVGYSEWWMPGFHRYLEGVYAGDLKSLNEQWSTNYQSFAQVVPKQSGAVVSKKTISERAAEGDHSWKTENSAPDKTAKTLAPYLDHRLYVETEVMQMFAEWRNAMLEHDPQAKVGFEGSGALEPYYGYDVRKLAETLDFYGPYWGPATNEVVRSFANKRLWWGNWWGGYTGSRWGDARRAKHYFWDGILSGSTATFIYALVGHDTIFNLDLSPATHFAAEDFKQLTNGFGEWLASAQADDDPVAILYSRPSMIVTSFESKWNYVGDVHHVWLALLRDLGIQSFYLASDQIDDGQLKQRNTKLLILPNAVAISDTTAAAIDAFVKSGGTVIADLRPGMTTEHGRYRDRGVLDRLFGIKRSTTQLDCTTGSLIAQGQTAGVPVDIRLAGYMTDSTISLNGGTAGGVIGDTPVLITKPQEKGLAILLNFNLFRYLARVNVDYGYYNVVPRREPDATVLADVFRRLMKSRGIRPKTDVKLIDGTDVLGVRSSYFKLDDIAVSACLRTVQQPYASAGPVNISLPKKGHVYDIRKGKYLGQTARISDPLPASEALFLATLPYCVTSLDVDLATAPQWGNVLEAAVRLTADGKIGQGHLVAVNVYGPDGDECLWARRLVWLTNGLGTFKLRLAFNEHSGRYTISAREITTGLQTTREFVLSSEPKN